MKRLFGWVNSLLVAASLLSVSGVAVAEDIVLGQSVALSGPASELGREMRLGAQLYFDAVNAQGGVKGKKIVLRTLDDGYEGDRAAANTQKFVNDGDVLALFGYVGTPTSLPSIKIATEAKIPFFGAFTGAQGLREPFNRYVFNVRSSYYDETELLVKQLLAEGVKSIAVFHQNDSYGQAGLAGVTRALKARNLEVFTTATVERNSNDVNKAVEHMVATKPEAIVMVSTYGSCAEFIKQTKVKGLLTRYANVSFVGTKSLVKALEGKGAGVIISQVMPSPWAQRYPWVQEYQRLLKAKNEEPSYTSLEGYFAAKVMVEALKRGGYASRDALVKALETMRDVNFDGFRVEFGPNDHNALQFVELTVVGRDGKIHY
jgi:branched-chain amino acid transport system substrate-binding protein